MEQDIYPNHTVHDTQGDTSSAPIIHIDSSDDEVILSSPRSFAQAKLNSRRLRGVAAPAVDVDSGNTEEHLSNLASGCTRRTSALTSETVINCDHDINMESNSNSVWNSMNGNAIMPPEQSTVWPYPTPPLEQSTFITCPTLSPEAFFSCPICMNPCIQLMSTLHGHVYCESCIKIMDSNETVINLQSSWNYVNGNTMKPPEQSMVWSSLTPPLQQSTVLPSPTPPPQQSTVLPSPTPPPEPICPICLHPFVESMTTKCGHVFCNSCIRAAITAQKKCPTCRQKLTAKSIFRVFLPSAS